MCYAALEWCIILLHIRFSKDVNTVDADLRRFIQNWMSTVSSVIATLFIIIYSTPIFVAVAIPLGILFIILQVSPSLVQKLPETSRLIYFLP